MPKFLYYPIVPFTITQTFGGNLATYAQFGVKGHTGIDLQAYHGQPVYASHDGMAYYEVDENQGCGVVVRTDVTYDYQGAPTHYKSIYWHLCDPKDPKYVSPVWQYGHDHNGAPLAVKAGDIVGYADNTGFSTGDHLHFGLKPQAINEDNGTWWNAEQNNGYAGAIDPTPYFNGIYATNAQYVLQQYSIYTNVLTFIRDWWTAYRAGKVNFK